MTSPNDTYKAAVLALQSRLGRPPTTKDPEYVRLGEECRLAWIRHGRAEETVLLPARIARDDAREEEEALRAPGAADNPPVALTELEGGSGPDSASQPAYVPRLRGWCSACGQYLARESVMVPLLNADGTSHSHRDPWELRPEQPAVMVGGRGPSGGRYAVCSTCRKVWERPVTRGRPAFKCPECRS